MRGDSVPQHDCGIHLRQGGVMSPHIRLNPSIALKIIGLLMLYLVGLSLLPSSSAESHMSGGTTPIWSQNR